MKKHHEEPARIDLSESEFETLILEIKQSSLSEKSKDLVVRVLISFVWLSRQLESKRLSIKKLLRLFFGSKTEKDSSPKGKDDDHNDKPSGKPIDPKPKVKGHGKNGEKKYENAERVAVPHPDLKPKDTCPACGLGRLYSFGFSVVLRIFGQAPLVAKKYELERLRCGSCQELFTAPLPREAGSERNHSSAKAMVAVLNYGSGFPFYRLEGLQQSMGTPIPDSTQFDMAEDVANCGAPIVAHWKKEAPNATQIANDDTGMPVLSLIKENKSLPDGGRRGMQTTATMALIDDKKVAFFETGRNHAGENIAELLKTRDPDLPKVRQVGDAASKNYSHIYMDLVIKVLCMDHGRRNFHELLDRFPIDCQYVIKELGLIYKHDAESKLLNQTNAERLEYHKIHSGPVMNGLNEWMEEQIENRKVEPNSPLGQAIDYFLTHWNGLTAFLRIEGAPLSNAEVERLVKRCVLRRKGSMFYFSLAGAWIGDVIMSLTETARINGANPHHYLTALQENKQLVRANPQQWQPWTYQQTLAAILP